MFPQPSHPIIEHPPAKDRLSTGARYAWRLAVLGAISGGIFGVVGSALLATGAMEEIAMATIGSAMAITSYVFAYAIEKLSRR